MKVSTQPDRAFPVIWVVVLLVLLILIPIAYFVGRNTVSMQEDPKQNIDIQRLQAGLQSRDQELASLKSETKRLKNRIAAAEAEVAEAKAAEDEAAKAEAAKAETVSKPKVERQGLSSTTVETAGISIRRKVAAALVNNLSDSIISPKIQIDQDTLWISVISDDALFNRGSTVPNSSLKGFLNVFFPLFVRTLQEFDQEIAEIRIQGHSSSTWKYAENLTDGYLGNMRLSIDRAESALKYCLGLEEVEEHRQWLTDRLVSVGFSDLKPMMDDTNQEDPLRSRRITFTVEVVDSSLAP